MREIKFRAWDDENKEMLPPQDLSQGIAYWTWLGLRDVTLMQFTGLKDKNGREIYEGDIVVKSFAGKEERRGVVTYGPGANFNLDCEDNDDQEGGRFGLGNPAYPENLEVIGNMYESETR